MNKFEVDWRDLKVTPPEQPEADEQYDAETIMLAMLKVAESDDPNKEEALDKLAQMATQGEGEATGVSEEPEPEVSEEQKCMNPVHPGPCEGPGGAEPAASPKLPKTPDEAVAAAPDKAKGILAKMASLPKTVKDYAVAKASAVYQKMEKRYGSKWAKVIVGVGILTLPTPVTSLSVALTMGLASLSNKIFGKAPMTEEKAEPLDMEQIKEIVKAMLEELGQSMSDMTEEDRAAIEQWLAANKESQPEE